LRLAQAYYARLFREYAIVDLSLAEERREAAAAVAAVGADDADDGAAAKAAKAAAATRTLADLQRLPPPKIGLRWRTRAEVVSGRGHLSCGSRACAQRAALATYELPFRWREQGEARDRAARVKVRLCPRCAALLPRPQGGSAGAARGGGR
jgi:hypothetical protein